jgi:hypothetical protein
MDSVTVSAAVLDRFERVSLYNSPYPAHDSGCAIDLYPERGTDIAVSPVCGTVRSVRTVRCPDRPYAVSEDHLLLIDCSDFIARILHVAPTVEAGEKIEVGDPIGTLIRSGFFHRWVDNHIHLGFRRPGQNLIRASGSVRIDLGVSVTGREWNGIGTVTEVGRTYVHLDSPSGSRTGFASLASDDGIPLDGGLAHYDGGGALTSTDRDVSLLGTVIGTGQGRDVAWNDVAVYADDHRATGLSLFAAQGALGTKILFQDGHDIAVGDELEITIEPASERVRLG